MKKFLIALLAALLVVGMFTVALADGGETPTTGEETPATETQHGVVTGDPDTQISGDKNPDAVDPAGDPVPGFPGATPKPYSDDPKVEPADPSATTVETNSCMHDGETHEEVVFQGSPICTAQRAVVTFCNKCGQPISTKYMDPLGHLADWSDTKVITPATCTTPGQMLVWCTRCNEYIDSAKIPGYTGKTIAPGHRFDKGTVVRAATCIEVGVMKYVCLDCGEIVEDELPRVKHTFDMKKNSTIVKVRGTCEKDGTYQAVCLTCGGVFTYNHYEGYGCKNAKGVAVEPQDTKGTDVLLIKARGHNYVDGIIKKAVTCKESGTIEYTCKNTKETLEYEPCNTTHIVTVNKDTMEYSTLVGMYTKKYHNWKEVVEKKPTATEPGIHYFYCTVCGEASKEMAYYQNAIVPPTPASTATTKPTTAPKPVTPNKKGVSIPKTNDTTSNLPYVLIAVAFVGLVALVASKRKVNG